MILEGVVREIRHELGDDFVAEGWWVLVLTPDGQEVLFWSNDKPALRTGDYVDLNLRKQSWLTVRLRGHEPWPWEDGGES